ncbi:MAG: hypothetical protein A2X35_04680 [Elusimicrobia bacterium GWA2_61_42]|nr:MAG: hypothetical protein A2X35_04680 [Elusimicrobia bacterium GWA2_61_42]OGR76635.1 MAG: hypothetical protein A2X38_03595 [Elusimicrobia bacterium GWC2_61_25]
MKRAIPTLLLMTAALAGGYSPLRAGSNGYEMQDASYYGDNDLKDSYEAGEIMRKYAESTAALFSDRAIAKDEAAGVYRLKTLSLQDKYNLRPGEPFGTQTVGAFCSGVLVGEDLVLTAGHCFKPDERGGPCEKVKFVFGYAVTRQGEIPSVFPAENVYGCGQIIAQRVQDQDKKDGSGHNFTCRNGACTQAPLAGNGPDYALIKLDRKVSGRIPLAINRAPVEQNASVGVIGYPSGMPVKVQEQGAAVRSVTRSGYFVANLDTFSGNSGSPVFNMRTMKIEGILARGGADFVYDSTPTAVEDPRNPYHYAPGRANVYPQDGGEGEEVTLITELQGLIPATEMEIYLNGMQRPQRGGVKAVPAIYVPGQDGGAIRPAVYTVPEPPAPQPVRI